MDLGTLKRLRELTGKSPSECKAALEAAGGDLAKAVRRLGGKMPRAPRVAWRYQFVDASGQAGADAWALVRRYTTTKNDDGHSVMDRAEHRLLRLSDGATFGAPGAEPAQGLWRSDDGALVVLTASVWSERPQLWLLRGPAEVAEAIPAGERAARLFGIGGRGAVCVGRDALHARDGTGWTAIPSPSPGYPFDVLALAGAKVDALVAGGVGHLLASWDGRAWTPIPLLGSAEERPYRFTAVHVAREEVWAVRADDELWRGDRSGLRFVTRAPHRISSLALWRDRVWLAMPETGLHVLDGERTTRVHPCVHTTSKLEARDELIFASDKQIAVCRDGAAFAILSDDPRRAFGGGDATQE